MAKDNQKKLYRVGDVVVIAKQEWCIEKVYAAEYRYLVVAVNPPPDCRWLSMYPNHNEITGLSQNALGGA